MKYTKCRMVGMVEDCKWMYDCIKNWNEACPPTEFKDGEVYNEPGHYIYGMAEGLGDAPYHGWEGDALKNERHHLEEIKKAHKALKVALQNALGIGQTKQEF